MTRVLLAIGCNTYDNLHQLNGAEADARRVFEALTDETIGGYDPSRSSLLLSPTLAQARAALETIVFGGSPLDVLTVFFAGHGDTRGTGFYLALRDTDLNRMSVSAFWLSDLFAAVAEAAPGHTNIILDACFSGGLAVDLSILTRSETSGYVGTPAITLLALASRDQEALESPEGGIGTNALLDCLEGRAFVRDDVASLDLLDIGQVVVDRVRRTVEQDPVLSALHVRHRSMFCRNPHFRRSASAALAKWEPRAFLEAVEPILSTQVSAPEDLIANVERLTGGIAALARSMDDVFRPLEIEATAAVALLPYCSVEPLIDAWVIECATRISDGIRDAISLAIDAQQAERFAFLAGLGGMSNLFYLPLRLSNILGWAGAAYHIDVALGRESSFPTDQFKMLLTLLAEHYGLSLRAMSERQGPGLALGLTAAHALGLLPEGEAVLSATFNDFIACEGKVAGAHIEPDQVLAYTLARNANDFSQHRRLVAQPTELGVVLLLSAPLFGLGAVFDEALIALDYLSINAFVPDDYTAFGQEVIDAGENNPFTIGHGVWTIGDLIENWPSEASLAPSNAAVCCGAILASLIFPDRIPWFLFDVPRLPGEPEDPS